MVREEATSKLAQALRSGRFAAIVDFVPTTVTDADAVKRLAAALPPSIDGVVASGDGVLSGVALSALLGAEGLEPVLGLSTADRNRSALLSDVRGAALLGVKSVFCRAGEHPSLGATPETGGAFDIDPVQLLQLLRDDDDGLSDLLLGIEVYPQLRPLELALIDARKKIAAGASLLITQPIFDLAAFDEWMTAVRAENLLESVPAVASVQALGSVEEAVALQRRLRIPDEVIARLQAADDAASEGITVCAETAAKVRGVEGVSGLYVRSSGKAEDIAEIMRRTGLTA